jgi:hypothetical protein
MLCQLLMPLLVMITKKKKQAVPVQATTTTNQNKKSKVPVPSEMKAATKKNNQNSVNKRGNGNQKEKKKQVEAVLQLAPGYVRECLTRQPTCQHHPLHRRPQVLIQKGNLLLHLLEVTLLQKDQKY